MALQNDRSTPISFERRQHHATSFLCIGIHGGLKGVGILGHPIAVGSIALKVADHHPLRNLRGTRPEP